MSRDGPELITHERNFEYAIIASFCKLVQTPTKPIIINQNINPQKIIFYEKSMFEGYICSLNTIYTTVTLIMCSIVHKT